ncbi:MAG TPA: protein kinase, partial [Ktedonobacteraceae bacterium]|nr:protein kinase [Ktedonobacteraceae bacterium]
FGLARAPGVQQITLAKTLVGSVYYSSPEQIWGKTLDNRSDIYALGVVLYEMVTGQRPFQGRTLQELAQIITAGRCPPPTVLNPELSPELEQIILTAMASNREERFVEASLMAEALRELQLRPSSGSPVPSQDRYVAPSFEQVEGGEYLTSAKRAQTPFPRFQRLDLPQIVPTTEPPASLSDPTKLQTSPLTSEQENNISEASAQGFSPSREAEFTHPPEPPDITPNT